MTREQKLVDISFQLVYTALENAEHFKSKTQEERMEWVAKQLRDCGFYTIPSGASWGVLVDKDRYEEILARHEA